MIHKYQFKAHYTLFDLCLCFNYFNIDLDEFIEAERVYVRRQLLFGISFRKTHSFQAFGRVQLQ